MAARGPEVFQRQKMPAGIAPQLLKARRIPTLPGAGAEATGAERGDARAPSPSP